MFTMTERIDLVLGAKSKKPGEDLPSFLKPLEILSRFVEVYQERSELNKTNLQILTKLRWDSLNNYLGWMVDRELVQTKMEGNTRTFCLTEKGRKSLHILAIFLSTLK